MNERDFQEFFENFINELKKENPNITQEDIFSIENAMKRAYVNSCVNVNGNNNTVIGGVGNKVEIKNGSVDPDIRLLTLEKFYKKNTEKGLKFKPLVDLSVASALGLLFVFAFTIFNGIAEAGLVNFVTGESTISHKDFLIGYVIFASLVIPAFIWAWYRNRYNIYETLPNDILYIEANFPDSPTKENVVKELKKLRRKLKILGLF
ncbi:hypothetical protein SAMN06265182_0975 [Persephonella hydrogeniphila]|uniref:Uncharacterized protein n=1 Tax=Persephonella hydrogeniphila TaxID=198703 RepID=A0A285NFN2_9AQUI|nr:hypothetical protein [Persephonella hydrogeniphila]SNZ07703.1 hypothetical protein SAMN06265182_0975 [Persephonella hydrogeniphila]